MNEQNVIVAVVVSATVIAITLVLQPKLDRWLTAKEKQVQIQAVNDCAKTASVQWKDADGVSVVTEPYKQAYQQCLKDKGY